MNTTVTMDEVTEQVQEKPGRQLSLLRKQKGYSPEYVAGKLHLRVHLIELLEADEYHRMPEPVFIKGYLRAYAKLLDAPAEPLLSQFKELYGSDYKLEKALWQNRRDTHRAERAIRWLTALFAVGVLTAVSVWWYSNKENERLFPTNAVRAEVDASKSETEIRLTDLSKMRSLLSSANNQYSSGLEIQGE